MKVLGHRGCIYEVENTLKSFEKAFELGADGVELDTQITNDGVVIISHDENLKRVFGIDFNIREHSMLELSNLNLKEKIPTLESVLEFAKSKNKIVDVELKNPNDLVYIAKIVESFNYDGFFISSFYHKAMLEGKKHFPHLTFAFLYDHVPEDISIYAKEIDLLKPNIEFLTEDYKNFSSITIPWTVNRVEDINKALSLGINMVITDFPDKILKSLTGSFKDDLKSLLNKVIVKEETDETKLTLQNRFSDMRIESILIDGRIVKPQLHFPFSFSIQDKMTIELTDLKEDSIITINIKEFGKIEGRLKDII